MGESLYSRQVSLQISPGPLVFTEAGVRRSNFAKDDLAQLTPRNTLQPLVALQTESIIPDVDSEIKSNIAAVETCMGNRDVLQITK